MFARELLFSRSDHTIHFSLLFKLWSFPALYIITIHQLIDGSSIQKCCSGVFCIALHLRAQINFLLRLSHQIMHFKITTQQNLRWAFLIVFENYFLKNHILHHCELATFFIIAGKLFTKEGKLLPLSENMYHLGKTFYYKGKTIYHWGKTFYHWGKTFYH